MAEARAFARHKIDRTCRQKTPVRQQRLVDHPGKFEFRPAGREGFAEGEQGAVGASGGCPDVAQLGCGLDQLQVGHQLRRLGDEGRSQPLLQAHVVVRVEIIGRNFDPHLRLPQPQPVGHQGECRERVFVLTSAVPMHFVNEGVVEELIPFPVAGQHNQRGGPSRNEQALEFLVTLGVGPSQPVNGNRVEEDEPIESVIGERLADTVQTGLEFSGSEVVARHAADSRRLGRTWLFCGGTRSSALPTDSAPGSCPFSDEPHRWR